MVSWSIISEEESPFVTALSQFQLPLLGSIFTIILITAAFSTMVGALFSITKVLVSLSHAGDAPTALDHHTKKGVAIRALGVNAIALSLMIVVSYVLPDKVYEYLTTAAGIMLILNWIVILAS
jgi:L-asparagine transporter-like permease